MLSAFCGRSSLPTARTCSNDFHFNDAFWPHPNVEQVREPAEDCSTRAVGNLGRFADRAATRNHLCDKLVSAHGARHTRRSSRLRLGNAAAGEHCALGNCARGGSDYRWAHSRERRRRKDVSHRHVSSGIDFSSHLWRTRLFWARLARTWSKRRRWQAAMKTSF
eukprot:COSAG02_NODE_112_length_35994_cov_12.152695_10_plen_164_part_00